MGDKREARLPADDPGNSTVEFRGNPSGSDTHESTTDSGAQLALKGSSNGALLPYGAHVLRENRNGFLMNLHFAGVQDESERPAALRMIDRGVPGAEASRFLAKRL